MGTDQRKYSGDSLFGKTRSAILALLYGRPDDSFYLREIVDLTQSGVGAVQRELLALQKLDVITREERGNQVHFRANSRSPLYIEIRNIVQKMEGWVAILQNGLAPLKGAIKMAFVYGNYAARAQTAKSDVDLFVVEKVDEIALHCALSGAEKKIAKTINYMLLNPREYAKRRREQDGFMLRILHGPKIPVIGGDS